MDDPKQEHNVLKITMRPKYMHSTYILSKKKKKTTESNTYATSHNNQSARRNQERGERGHIKRKEEEERRRRDGGEFPKLGGGLRKAWKGWGIAGEVGGRGGVKGGRRRMGEG